VNCINHRDLPGLVSLMSDDHRLQVFDETPVTGRDDNERAWSGYFEAFPTYLIHPHQIAEAPDGEVAVLGHTTGSHLGLAPPWRESSHLGQPGITTHHDLDRGVSAGCRQ
jgi:hypothetical protein